MKLRVVKKQTTEGVTLAKGTLTLKQERHKRLSGRYKKAFIVSVLINLLLTTIIGILCLKG